MKEEEFIEVLQEVLWAADEQQEDGLIADMRSFESAMLLTKDKGFICKLESGEEFQVTVVRSK